MSSPQRPVGTVRDGGVEHPPLRLRRHSRLLLPDLRLPPLRELRATRPPRTIVAEQVSAPVRRAASADVTIDEAAVTSHHAPPLYWRLLRLRHVRPNGWLRALYFEGAVAVAVVLVLAEAASVWTILVLPAVVAVLVKANDVLAGTLRRASRTAESVSSSAGTRGSAGHRSGQQAASL